MAADGYLALFLPCPAGFPSPSPSQQLLSVQIHSRNPAKVQHPWLLGLVCLLCPSQGTEHLSWEPTNSLWDLFLGSLLDGLKTPQ